MRKKAFVTLRMSDGLLKRIDDHAERVHRSRGDTMRLILEFYLDWIDKRDERDAERRTGSTPAMFDENYVAQRTPEQQQEHARPARAARARNIRRLSGPRRTA